MKDKRAFTLVEILGVLVVISLISAIAIPTVTSIVNKSKRKTAEEAAKAISRAARNYYEAQQLDYVEVKEVSLVDKTIEFEGKRPAKGAAYFDENGHMYLKMYYNGYCVVVDEQGETTSEITSQQDCKVNVVLVSFETGDKNITIPSFEKEQGNVIGELPVLEREGYIFKGWYYKDINGNEQQASSNTIMQDSVVMTLYAKWEPCKYTVTFVYNYDAVSNTSTLVTYNSTYGDLPSPSRTGYTLQGWYTTSGVKVDSSTAVTISSNHTLYAHWSVNTYKIQFNANGGTGTMSSMTCTYNVECVLNKNEFLLSAKSFKGWATSAGGAVLYDDEETVINLTAIDGEIITLYAKWGVEKPTLDTNPAE